MTPRRLLVGPADAAFADRFVPADGDCRAFGPADGWNTVAGWAPDAVLVRAGVAPVPDWVWPCPAPVVVLADDPDLLWHAYRELLPLFDLVLADRPAVARLTRAGVSHARPANLCGLDRHFLAESDTPESERDLDIVFVGNLHPAVRGGRLRWLGRVARLADRSRVLITTGVFGADYRALLRRARVCFNWSARGECNRRALEAAACGAVLFQEAENAEVPLYLEPRTEYVPYTADDLEEQLARCLDDEPGRRATAGRARERVRRYGWLDLLRGALADCEADWPAVRDRAARRAAGTARPSPAVAVWYPGAPDTEPAADGNRVFAVGRATALLERGRAAAAAAAARRALADLDARPALAPDELASCPYPRRFDDLRVGWERAAWDHPDDPAGEAADKLALLRCRANAVIAQATGDLTAHEAAARSGVPALRAAYGCALARAGRFEEAVGYLSFAVEMNPFDAAAARALVAALSDAGRPGEAAALLDDRRRLARAAPGLVADAGLPAGGTRVIPISRDEFARWIGNPDTSAALCGFTPASDTHVILALVVRLAPRRVLEIGTAAGHMTANLCAFTPPDAVVFSLGVVGEDRPASGAAEQEYEVPPRSAFARHVDHFGTAHKAMLVTADSRAYDFGRFAPLDLVFVDGGHDLETARSDSARACAALRPGGCLVWHDFGSRVPWVKVREAVASLNFAEPVYHVEGTEVAFLFKGEAVAGDPARCTLAVAWDGEFEPVHSLAGVNRAVCGELAARGHELALVARPPGPAGGARAPLPPALRDLVGRVLPRPADVYVRHRWPPDFTPPAGGGAFVLVQPWEYGRLPRAWVGSIREVVDEVWAYSRAVERAYIASGVPAERVKVIPLGVDTDRFRPGLPPLPMRTDRRVRLLFVGGTIWRKGFDVLLAAYRTAFRAADDVCLVVKEFGAGAFYRGQTAGDEVSRHRADPTAPAIEYLTDDLSEPDLPRLYAACDALVHPYRGEGFALPVLEAMACGLPVVVTAGGPTDEFVPPPACWRVPAAVAYFPDETVGPWETAGRPWCLEPDPHALAEILRAVAADVRGRQERGAAGRRAAPGWTWARAAAAVEDRVRELRARTPVRFRGR
jgi:glycosyltransferase involved in cell wall biosynthesis/predicted O-methyltransferase YrrM